MKHVSIPLSDAQHAALDAGVSAGDYASIEDYLTALVDAEARARARKRLEGLLLDGLASPKNRWGSGSMAELQRRAQQRL